MRSRGGRALIPYLTAGYPEPDRTAGLLDVLAEAGADVIELGVPFSDPVADGPTIQRASQRAIERGVTLRWTLETLRSFHARCDVPVVLFSYLNPVIDYGVDRFIADAADAGAAGVLITDLPAGADRDLERRLQDAPFSFIRLAAPTTPPARLLEIAATAQGFLYYVGRMGVTGARQELRQETLAEVAALRASVAVPVAVGFGVSTPAQAAAVARVADGVIIGSALIDALDDGGNAGVDELMRDLRTAIDSV
ncbi:MAG: tryptophan synthase subunit alpha [Gemmatimonadetes bacterium]|nr:tryptophan synthase subunit alpha [Gemmatimonadota bacterium]